MSEESQGQIPNVGFNYAELEARYMALYVKNLRAHKESLDILVAMWVSETKKLPTQSTVMELMEWIHERARDPGKNFRR